MGVDYQEFNGINRNLRGNALKRYVKSLPPLTNVQKEILVGTLLGDSTMKTGGAANRPAQNQFSFTQKASMVEYVQQMYMNFKQFVGAQPRFGKPSGSSTSREGSYAFKTYRVASFRYFAVLFYGTEFPYTKSVPKNIGKLLTARSLAYWYMDDGSFGQRRVVLHTQGFSHEDQVILKAALKDKFDLDFSIVRDRRHYKLSLRKHSNQTFFELVYPYIYSCFSYKLPQRFLNRIRQESFNHYSRFF
uniref:Putative site-specific DNA endonuclease n=1 Tax=Oltmannsiellopsis viridis TaxID=51324 RepID=Q0QIS0_OLTVI|nr:putative site-specific DNA endonuclease [Oltmannsiellopsis viridis]ABC96334.1 putative site-specific DNA endonuclease [Oltmannsiellopsis viridis]